MKKNKSLQKTTNIGILTQNDDLARRGLSDLFGSKKQQGFISYFAQRLIKQNTYEEFLQQHPNWNSESGGLKKMVNARGYWGFISTDKTTIPYVKGVENLTIDEDIVKLFTSNNGDLEISILKENQSALGTFEIIYHIGIVPIAREVGLDKIPAVILDDNAPYLVDGYDMLKKAQIQPVHIKGGIPLSMQV